MSQQQFYLDLLRAYGDTHSRPQISSNSDVMSSKFANALQTVWLNPSTVSEYVPADFAGWQPADQQELARAIASFRTVAGSLSSGGPASDDAVRQGREHLQAIFNIVGAHLLKEWIFALRTLFIQISQAAADDSWFVEEDEKQIHERLLGTYQAPRLRLRTLDVDFVLSPAHRFGFEAKGVVDVVQLPDFETRHYLVYDEGHWSLQRGSGETVSDARFVQELLADMCAAQPEMLRVFRTV